MTFMGLRGSLGSGTKPRAGRHSLWGARVGCFRGAFWVIEFVVHLGHLEVLNTEPRGSSDLSMSPFGLCSSGGGVHYPHLYTRSS